MVADLEKINRSIAISGWKPNAILGISRGGLIPAVHLSHYWDVPLETCQVSLRDEKHIDRTNKLMPLTIFNLLEMSKNILVVDDICDSGKTFEYIYNYYANKSFNIAEKKFMFLNSTWLFPEKKAKFFRPIFGKLWSCSEKISKLGKLKVKQTDEMCLQLSNFENKNSQAVRVFEYVKIWSCKAENLVVSGLSAIREVLKIHVLKILYPVIQLEISV